MEKRSSLSLIYIMILSIIVMAIVEAYIQPGYFIKSLVKIFVFLVVPLIYAFRKKDFPLVLLFKINSRKEFIRSLVLAFTIYIGIMTAYFILRSFIDFNNIQNILADNLNISKANFIYVALYISFINSLLEEFFFRGFIFLNLNGTIPRWKAYAISALGFSVYHIAILSNWFNPFIFILALTGLFIGGIIFNWLNEKTKNIYNSWLVHMFANFAINTVGLMMFNII
ncbi:MAG: CPBP family intramembrane metalloprotease [Tissierellales bacterium]